MNSERRRSTLGRSHAQVLLLAAFGCALLALPVNAATLNVPSSSGVIRSPKGHVFENMELRIQWHCTEESHFPMSPTGQKGCGGIGPKSGTQIVAIAGDGSFVTSPIKVTRNSLTRESRFHLQFGLFVNGERPDFRASEYSGIYSESAEGGVAERLARDLSQLRLIRVLGGKFSVRIEAHEGGNVGHLDSLLEKYPKSYNYSSRVILSLAASQGGEPVTVDLDVRNSEVEIPDFEFMQVGSESQISMSALISAQLGLVKQQGEYEYYSDEIRLQDLVLEVSENLEARIQPGFLDEVEIVLDIE